MKRLWLSASLLLTAAGLSACGGGGSSDTATVTTPPPAMTALADRFGAGFGTAFRVTANAEPRAVAAGDVDPVNVAAVPLALQ